jgi:hypothetical protein
VNFPIVSGHAKAIATDVENSIRNGHTWDDVAGIVSKKLDQFESTYVGGPLPPEVREQLAKAVALQLVQHQHDDHSAQVVLSQLLKTDEQHAKVRMQQAAGALGGVVSGAHADPSLDAFIHNMGLRAAWPDPSHAPKLDPRIRLPADAKISRLDEQQNFCVDIDPKTTLVVNPIQIPDAGLLKPALSQQGYSPLPEGGYLRVSPTPYVDQHHHVSWLGYLRDPHGGPGTSHMVILNTSMEHDASQASFAQHAAEARTRMQQLVGQMFPGLALA